MRRVALITLTLSLLPGCRSIAGPSDFAGTYFRLATVHNAPSGRLVLSKDGRYRFVSVIPGTVDPATGAPFYTEDLGTWTVDLPAIILRADSGEERKLVVRHSRSPIELEWSAAVRLRKESNQSPTSEPGALP